MTTNVSSKATHERGLYSNPQPPLSSHSFTVRRGMQLLARKRFMLSILIWASISCVLLLTYALRHFYPNLNLVLSTEFERSQANFDPPPDLLHPLVSLNGPPTRAYKDNLRNQTKYITSWGSSAGWANDVISFLNLVYLGLITDRVAILPVFTSTHLPPDTPPLPFGEVFDLPRLRTALGLPILEWRDVKEKDSEVLEDIGCWNVWESVQFNDKAPRHSSVTEKLNLDISYTKTPQWIKMIPNYEHDQHSTFWSLASLAFSEARNANLVPPLPSPQHRVSLPPDEQLLCFDFLYYVAAQEPDEVRLDYSPAWRFVGQYMRWTDTLERLTDAYLRHTLGVGAHDPIPLFISVHARRDDFQNWCGEFTKEECFAPLSVIARRVDEVKAEVLQQKGVAVNHVIITSDERDEAWWDQVAEQGWRTPDHAGLKTEERYGVWYPVLIDAVIHSRGSGFVGTSRSTFSILAARRVSSWNNGPVRMVEWGSPTADSHLEM
ncbi:hypothetical protein DFH08DRAFT_843459 [Mycena albidolilacea]|uniref:Uncharacterized protein n=1 Tax=Mycena albidolilacea TaxID=1033008 RepID=A0AAD7AKC8_9AGAR|nr:hypothetical protein DFH08DRAFT_843459 [Mycena albidolilacea]